MRERIQGIVAIIIVILICITFVFFGVENYLRSHSDANVIAKVNGVKITQKQVHIAYERAKQRLMQGMGKNYSYEQKFQDQIKSEVIQELIRSEVLLQGLSNLKFKVNPAQVEGIIQQLPMFQIDGHFSKEKFQKMLNSMMFSPADFFNELKNSIMISQLRNGLIMSSFILPNETDEAIKIFNQTRDIKYTILTADSLKNNIKLIDSDIENYYQQHQDEFQTPEQISLSYIELSAESLKTKVSITPDQVQQYYKDHIDNYSSPQRWQIERILVQVPANGTQKTEDKAKQRIEDLVKQARSGVAFSKLDPLNGKAIWISEKQIPHGANPMNVLKSMKVGEISGPFRTPSEFFVVKISQMQPAKIQSFATVHEQVTKALIQEKLAQLFSEQSNKLSDLTYTNSNSLLPAATELGLSIKTTELFTEAGVKAGILANSKIVKTAFSDMVLRQNYNSELVELEPGHVLVMRVKEHNMPSVKPLAEIKPQIIKQLSLVATKQKVKELGDQLVETLKANPLADNVIKQHGLSWKILHKIKREEINHLDPSIVTAAFSVPSTNKHLAVIGVILENDDYAIIQVDHVYDGDSKNFSAKQLKALKHNVSILYGEIDYHLFVEDMIRQAKIKQYDKK